MMSAKKKVNKGSSLISGSTNAEIVSSIESGIRSGLFNPGASLPAIRSLARDLAVNRNTVWSAYSRLAAMGLLVSDRRRGSRIAQAPYERNVRTAIGFTDLGSGDPDPKFLPDPLSVLTRLSIPRYPYEGPTELGELLTTVRRLLEDDEIPSTHVAFTSGAFDAIRDILSAYVKHGDKILLEDPCFTTSHHLARALGLVVVAGTVDDEGLLPEQLQSGIEGGAKVVLLTPAAHNPTGALWTSQRQGDLRRVLARHPDVVVIEDDYFRPLMTIGSPRSLAAARRSKWAVVRSVSKYLGPDLRFAYVAGDEETIRQIRLRRNCSARRVSGILQHIVLGLIQNAVTWKVIDKAARVYDERRVALIKALLKAGVSARGKSGFNVWVEVPDETGIAQLLLNRGWLVRTGNVFRIDSPQGIRLTTSSLEAQESDRFARDLARAISEIGTNGWA